MFAHMAQIWENWPIYKGLMGDQYCITDVSNPE